MFAGHEVEGTDWVSAALRVPTEVNSRVSKSRGQSPFFTLHGFQLKGSSTELPSAISVSSDPAHRYYSAAEKLNSARHRHI